MFHSLIHNNMENKAYLFSLKDAVPSLALSGIKQHTDLKMCICLFFVATRLLVQYEKKLVFNSKILNFNNEYAC